MTESRTTFSYAAWSACLHSNNENMGSSSYLDLDISEGLEKQVKIDCAINPFVQGAPSVCTPAELTEG